MARCVRTHPAEGDVLETQDGHRFEVIELFGGNVSVMDRHNGRSKLHLVPIGGYAALIKNASNILHTEDAEVTLQRPAEARLAPSADDVYREERRWKTLRETPWPKK